MAINDDLNTLRDDLSDGDTGHILDHLRITRVIKELKVLNDQAAANLNRNSKSKNPYPKLAGLGDSLMAVNTPLTGQHRAWRESWLDLGVLFSNSKWNYFGVSAYGGITIEQAAGEYLTSVINANPDYCVVLIGQNSIGDGFTTAEQNALNGIYVSLMNNGITPILVTNVPSTNDSVNLQLNRFIRSKSEQYSLPLFDAWQILVDPVTGTYQDGLSNDGTHPSPAGAKALADGFASFTEQLLGNYSGTEQRLVSSANDDRPGGSNGLLLSNSGGYPAFWAGITAGDAEIEDGYVGSAFVATKTSSSVRFQVNCNEIPVSGSGIRTYRFSSRFSAQVANYEGSWAIEVLDVTNGYNMLASWENIPFNVSVNTVMSTRFRTAANTANILVVLKVMGGPASFSESGGVGSTIKISQITFEQIT